VTPEEKAVIHAALMWSNKQTPERVTDLHVAVRALRVSRQPIQGPEAIPCMVKAMHGPMFCILPKGHEGSIIPDDAESWQQCTDHEGYPDNNPKFGRRAFQVWEPIREAK
jgi:hypothetical protein